MTKHGRYKDRDYIQELWSRRRAMKADAFVETVNPAIVYERDMGLCGICGLPVEGDDFNMDHRVPLMLGGKHSYDNCQTAHALCNLRKAAKMPEDCTHLWARN
jgi:5-methylcytosine-specific restriction endonuclease McrA